MKRGTKWTPWVLVVVGAAVLSGAIADEPKKEKSNPLDMLKRLEGTWVQVGEDGEPTDIIVSRCRSTAGGTAYVEENFPGTDHEMLTVYHVDGDQLLLTHYCVMGNAPRMAFRPTDDPNVWKFVCDGHGTNLDEKDPHMHQGVFTWTGEDRFHGAWTMHAGGQAGQTVEIHAVRKP